MRAAHLAGVLQLILALGVLVRGDQTLYIRQRARVADNDGRRVPGIARQHGLLLLISKHREGGAHMKASWIFSANDVVINMGVIVAGALVAWTGSNYPDLIIGTVVDSSFSTALGVFWRSRVEGAPLQKKGVFMPVSHPGLWRQQNWRRRFSRWRMVGIAERGLQSPSARRSRTDRLFLHAVGGSPACLAQLDQAYRLATCHRSLR